MTTIDRNGAWHDDAGQYANKGNPHAGYDLGAMFAAIEQGEEDPTTHYGDPDTPVPDAVSTAIATYQYGTKGYVVPGPSTQTRWGMDGGGYTLHGTRIAGPEGEHGLVYRKETGEYVVEHYDGSGSTWRDNGDGTLTKKDWYSGGETTITTSAATEASTVQDDEYWSSSVESDLDGGMWGEPHECPFCDAYGCRAAQTGEPADCGLNEAVGYHGDAEDGGRERELLAMEDEARQAAASEGDWR